MEKFIFCDYLGLNHQNAEFLFFWPSEVFIIIFNQNFHYFFGQKSEFLSWIMKIFPQNNVRNHDSV